MTADGQSGLAGDGGVNRGARGERTRRAVVDALLALIEAGEPKPGARQVAERAGVSTRTVFAHFASLEDLYRASAERVAARAIAMLTPIAPDQPLAARIASLGAQRARVNEAIGPIRRAAALQAGLSPALAAARERGRQASQAQVRRVFARELDALDDGARRRAAAAVDALLTGETWDLLRTAHGLSVDAAQLAIVEALRALFAAAAPPAASTSTAAAPSAAEGRRRRAAQRALADVDRRIERLVAAIEAGAPADLLTPRLETLRQQRRDIEHDAGT